MTRVPRVVVLGATGVIGSREAERLVADPACEVVAVAAAGTTLPLLAYQAVALGVYGVALAQGDLPAVHAALEEANARAGTHVRPEILVGHDTATHAAAAGVDTVINAIRGAAGVDPSIAALRSGAHLRVANTETLLAAGLLAPSLRDGERLSQRLTLLNPRLDGIQEALEGGGAERVILTVRTPRPGRRRTTAMVDALTGLGAGLALLELRAITDIPIDIVRHDGPITAIVEREGGHVVLTGRRRGARLDRPRTLTFEPTSSAGFDLAASAAEAEGTYPLVLHAANEVAAAAHLAGELPADAVLDVVAEVLDLHDDPGLALPHLAPTARWAAQAARAAVARR